MSAAVVLKRPDDGITERKNGFGYDGFALSLDNVTGVGRIPLAELWKPDHARHWTEFFALKFVGFTDSTNA